MLFEGLPLNRVGIRDPVRIGRPRSSACGLSSEIALSVVNTDVAFAAWKLVGIFSRIGNQTGAIGHYRGRRPMVDDPAI